MTTPLNNNRTKERTKKTGEVFTPRSLVLEMLDKLPEDTWQTTKNFLDNSCGNGNFIIEIIQRKIEKGLTIIQALKTTYGLDLMPDNIEDCHQRILDIVGYTKEHEDIITHNIVCHDALNGWDYENWKPEGQDQKDSNDSLLKF
jgi:hypothetical protein